MDYPVSFTNKIIGAFGNEGETWLHSLQTIISSYLKEWNLEALGPVDNLSYNYVLKVKDAKGNPAILKLGVANYDFENEIRTLCTYGGVGCVRLVKEDAKGGAMLLEHMLPGTMLLEVKDERLAIRHFAHVWKAIRRPISENANHPSINDWMKTFDRYVEKYPENDGPIDNKVILLATSYYTEIMDTSTGVELLHGDLHQENILYSVSNGWVAIDPKGVIGDCYFDIISFLTNQLFNKKNPKELLLNRIALLCEELQLDYERLVKAGFVMSLLYTCWGLEDNSDWVNTYECVKWFDELIYK